MRSAVIIFAAAILARAAMTPVYYLVVDADDGAPPQRSGMLAGSLAQCEEALALSAVPAHCRSVSGARHLFGAAASVFETISRPSWDPVEEAPAAALDAVQDAALDAVQDAAIDAVRDAVGGDDGAPLD